MEFNRKNAIIDFLKNHEGQKFTPSEIAKRLVEDYPEEARRKISTSKNKDILAAKTQERKIKEVTKAYANEISGGIFKEWRLNPNIRIESEPQIRLYNAQNFNAQVKNQQVKSSEKINKVISKKDDITEKQVYIALEMYLKNKLNVHNMRINHNFSSNKQGAKGNVWLHPDLVGMEVLNETWDPLIKDCAIHQGGKQARLWSFEVKTEIERSNLRLSFFQAVSNSSWAHRGYLVAAELVETKYDTMLATEVK